MQRYEFSDGKSNKFWQIEQHGSDLHIAWGKVGTAGQSQVKGFDSEAKAQTAKDKLVKEKTGKGYAAVGESTTSSTPAPSAPAREAQSASEPAAPTAKAKKTAPQAEHASPANPEKVQAADPLCVQPKAQAAFAQTSASADWGSAPGIDAIALDGVRLALTQIAAGKANNPYLSAKDVKALTGAAIWRDVPEALALACHWLAGSAVCGGTRYAPLVDEAQPAAQWQLGRLGSDVGEAWQAPGLTQQWAQVQAASAQAKAGDAPSAWLGGTQPLMPLWCLHRDVCEQAPLDRAQAWAVVQGALPRVTRLKGVLGEDVAALAFSRHLKGALDMQQVQAQAGEAVAGLVHQLGQEEGQLSAAQAGILLALLMADAEGAPGREAEQQLLALGDWLVAGDWAELLLAVTLTGKLELSEDGQWLTLGRRFDSRLHGALALRWRSWVAAQTPERAQALNALTLAELDYSSDVEDHPALMLLTARADVLATYQAWLEAGQRFNARQLLAWLPPGETDQVADRAVVLNQPIWLAQWLQDWGAAPDFAQRLGQFGRVTSMPMQYALGTVPHLSAFQAMVQAVLADKDQDWAALDAACLRWPFLATVVITQTVAGGRNPSVQLLARLNAALGRLQPVAKQLPAVLAPWLKPAQQAWLTERCTRLAEPVEVADCSALPAVLVDPPWRRGERPKPGAVLAVSPPNIAPVLGWPADAREAVLANDTDWQRQFQTPAESLHPVQVAQALNVANATVTDAIARGDAAALVQAYVVRWYDANKIQRLPPALQAPFWEATAHWASDPTTWVAHMGEAAVSGLVHRICENLSDNLTWFTRVGDVRLAGLAAQTAFATKALRAAGLAWLRAWPEHAAAGVLADALGKPGKARTQAGQALRYLVAQGHGAMVKDVAARAQGADAVALTQALQAVLDEDPMLAYPAKIASLPSFWPPMAWRKPVLKGGAALPKETLQVLGEMLSFPRTEGEYPGLAQVKRACTAPSLAAFAWDCFEAWLAVGAPAKENWSMWALAAFGDDEVARKLTTLIRVWPGESANARAVTGLDVLEAIGTDTALMMLNGIAQKLKFKGLQDKAREKIEAIAEARGLSMAELEDRIAPDLGLDAQGALVLDFGPRQFKAGFDESLKPVVRDFTGGQLGARLKDLPKPRQDDDAALAAAATERFKALKKDAKTIATQQIQRLESAMCQERLWSWDEFQLFIAQHPLVRHIAQRLVWGVFEVEAQKSGGSADIPADGDAHALDFPKHGGRLLACFHLTEDGSATTAEHDAFVLPEASGPEQAIRVGVPHALRLLAADQQAFGALLADYELLQPFEQLGRETHALTEAEQQAKVITRWVDQVVPTGKVLALLNRGWWKGQAQDGGGIWYFSKPVAGGRVVELGLDPGLLVGVPNEFDEQTLGELHVGTPSSWGEMNARDHLAFGELGDIGASELLRDMSSMGPA